MKICNTCKVFKSEDSFQKNRKNSLHTRKICNSCSYSLRKDQKSEYKKTENYKQRSKYYKLKDRYGLSREEYDQLIDQNPSCQSCKEFFTATPHIDHDHTTEKVRGLLCGNCNKALGLLKDDPIKIVNLLRYLLEGSETISKESTPKQVEVPSP